MRRALIVLLAFILPLKAIGAAVVPITGAPHHHHGAAASHGPAAHEAPAHSTCDGLSMDASADATVVHEHACPHLTMVTLVAASAMPDRDQRSPEAGRYQVPRFRSVVLDILHPPPTLRA